MSGPWEKYQNNVDSTSQESDIQPTETSEESGPWSKYSGQEQDFTQANIPQEPAQPQGTQLQQMLPEVPAPITDMIVAPMVEMSRGLYRSAGSFMGKLDAMSTLIEKTTGIKKGGLFNELANIDNQVADTLPQTGLSKPAQTVYEMIGGAAPTIAEFATVSKVPGFEGVTALSQAGQFALMQSLDEYRKNPELSSLAKGAFEGAEQGMATMAGFKLGEIGIDLMHKAGKGAVKAYLSFVTGDKKLADEFIKDPNKFNTGLRNKVPTLEDVKAQNEIKQKEITVKISNERNLFKDNLNRERELLDMKLKDAETKLKDISNNAKLELKTASTTTLDETAKSASQAIEQNTIAMQEKAVSIFDNALTKYKSVKKEAGERVESAIDSIVQFDPLVSLPTGFIKNKVENIIKKESPFIMQGGRYTTRTPAGNQQEANLFNKVIDDFNQRVKNNDLTLGYLQYLKKDLQTLSDKSFTAGNNELGKLYQSMSKELNPAKLADEFVKIAPNASSSIRELAKANKSYSTLMTQYERAMDKYFTKNVRNEYIPNPNKAISAIANNDIATLREMKIADSALPAGERILPQLESLHNQANKMESDYRSIMSSLKRKAKEEYRLLSDSSKKSIENLRREQHKLRIDEKNKAIMNIRDFNTKKDAEYSEILNQISKEETFFKNQDFLRQHVANSKMGANLLQRILGLGVLAVKIGQVGYGTASGIGAVMLSPNVAAKTSRIALAEQENAKSILTPIFQKKLLQQLVGVKAEQQ